MEFWLWKRSVYIVILICILAVINQGHTSVLKLYLGLRAVPIVITTHTISYDVNKYKYSSCYRVASTPKYCDIAIYHALCTYPTQERRYPPLSPSYHCNSTVQQQQQQFDVLAKNQQNQQSVRHHEDPNSKLIFLDFILLVPIVIFVQ